MQKKLSFLMALVCICFTLTSCYDAREIDDEVYAIAVGVDKGSSNKIRLTIEYPNYKSDGSSSSKDDKSKNVKGGSNIGSIECPTIMEGIAMFGMSISRRIALTHVKILVIAEEIARDGVIGIIAPLERYNETRSSMNVIVSRGSAEDFLNENVTSIGSSISKSIELLIQQSYFSNYFHAESFLDFYKALYSNYRQPIALYGGVNAFNKIIEGSKESPLITGKGVAPGEQARKGTVKRELAGMAVFRKDKMVGYLDSYETAYFLMIEGKLTSRIISIEDKYAAGEAIVARLRNSRRPVIKAAFEDGKPVVNIKIKLEGDISEIQSKTNYEDANSIESLNKQIEDFLMEGVKKTIEKTQKEMKSDIFGFGRQFAGHFADIQEWEKYDWLNRYHEAKVNVNIDVNVRRTGILIGITKIRTDSNVENEE